MTQITGIITTLNEEKNIVDCIKSLQQICEEIIVIDSLSSDHTVELAKSLGAKIYLQSYLGDGIQKNFGLQYASNKWIFSLDADERLTHELVAAVQKLDLENTSYDGFAFSRKNFIGSRWMRRCGWYPDYCTRLYDQTKTRFADVKQHAFVVSKHVQKISADIIHYSFHNVGELFGKPERNYSSRSAKIMYLKGKKVHAFDPFLHGFSGFFVSYFVRGGIFAGIDGLSVSLCTALNSYLKYAKLIEFYRDKKVVENEDFNRVF